MQELSGKTVALFIENIYQDQEAWYPYFRLTEAGAQVHVVGPEKGKTYESKHGYAMESTHAAADVSAADYDALVIPGGYAPDKMRTNADMVAFTKAMHEAGKPVAAICHAGWMLASAGIVDGKKVTSVKAIRDDLTNAGATWVDEECVRDDNLITSRQPHDLPAFCRTLIQALEE